MKNIFILFKMCFMCVCVSLEIAITRDGGVTTGEIVTFWYNSSSTKLATFKFEFCEVAKCDENPGGYGLSLHNPKSLDDNCRKGTQYICVTDNYYGSNCAYYGAVGWNTGDTNWGYKPRSALSRRDENGRSLLSRMTLYKLPCSNGRGTQLVLTIENPGPKDAGTYILATYRGSNSYRTRFNISDMVDSPRWKIAKFNKTEKVVKTKVHRNGGMTAISNPTIEDVYAVETGYNDVNVWLEWMKYSAMQSNKSNCYVCSGIRPHLGSVPLHLGPAIEECFLSLFTNRTTSNPDCEMWKVKYPIVTQKPTPTYGITIYPGNYTCFNNTDGDRDLGVFKPGYCETYSNASKDQYLYQVQSVADVFWICGDMKIRSRLEGNWSGECALAKAIMPLHIMPLKDSEMGQGHNTRHRRSSELPKGSFDPHVYIDAIGVPRGVPSEFKARDQVKAGFESLLPQITVNKNVDWINYIYYNQQRFVNYTRDALHGLADQLGPASIMAFQNRMALDLILAEKGGVCKMIRDVCCTFIPDNTGPNGKVTLAISKLDSLSQELKRNSGITDPWDQYFSWMSGWQRWLTRIGIILGAVLLMCLVVILCVIPCIKKTVSKTVDSATEGLYPVVPQETCIDVNPEEEDMPTRLMTPPPCRKSMLLE